MLVKKKRLRAIFLAFLVIFTHDSLSTRLGRSVAVASSIALTVFSIYHMKKMIFRCLYNNSGIKIYQRKTGEPLTFAKDYFGAPPEVKTLVSWIKNNADYKEFGIGKMKNLLICGKSGTGKSYLARVIADEVDAVLYYLKGTKVINEHEWQGVNSLKSAFSQAKKNKNTSIVLIDEFEQMYPTDPSSYENDKVLSAMSRLQIEIDDVNNEDNNKIIVIGLSKKQPELPNNIIRRRFDIIQLFPPKEQERECFLRFYLDKYMELEKVKKMCVLSKDINFSHLARKAEGFGIEELKDIVNNLFIRVVDQVKNHGKKDLIVTDGKIEIRQENLEAELKKLKDKIKTCQRKIRERLTFAKDYFGVVPPEVKTLVNWIKNNADYKKFGVDKMKSLLICGELGTGKSHLVRVIADEVNAVVYSFKGGEVVNGDKWNGGGAELIKLVFSQAKKTKNTSIVLIDEFEQMCLTKDPNHYEKAKSLLVMSVLQTEMDAVNNEDKNKVTVIGLSKEQPALNYATSRQFNIVKFFLPTEQKRENFLKSFFDKHMELEKIKEMCILSKYINFSCLAQKTEGFGIEELKGIVDNLFIQVIEKATNYGERDLIATDEKIEIKQENFEEELKRLRGKIEITKESLLNSNKLELLS